MRVNTALLEGLRGLQAAEALCEQFLRAVGLKVDE
jgi:hypothetical protein